MTTAMPPSAGLEQEDAVLDDEADQQDEAGDRRDVERVPVAASTRRPPTVESGAPISTTAA